jgi:tetratricopeptide (TPR) repeat protein
MALDDQNRYYWKRFATINKAINNFEEAEFGYRKAVEFGDFQLETWMLWVDMMINMGELNNAILTLIEASNNFQDNAEIEYRLAGLHYQLNEIEKGNYHLSSGLHINFDQKSILEELFPLVWQNQLVQEYIAKHNKPQ